MDKGGISPAQPRPATAEQDVVLDFMRVNAEPTPYDPLAAEVVREPIGTALPALLDGLEGS